METTATLNATINPTASPVHVGIDKKVTEGGPALALLLNKWEEEMNIDGGTMGANCNITVRISKRTFKPLDRLGRVLYF